MSPRHVTPLFSRPLAVVAALGCRTSKAIVTDRSCRAKQLADHIPRSPDVRLIVLPPSKGGADGGGIPGIMQQAGKAGCLDSPGPRDLQKLSRSNLHPTCKTIVNMADKNANLHIVVIGAGKSV